MRIGTVTMPAFHLFAAGIALTFVTELVAPHADAAQSGKPRWVLHVENFPGGISNGVRFSLDPEVLRAQGRYRANVAPPRSVGKRNVQMNDDSYPELPQNEESVAYSTDNPLIAVAAANDYVSGGVVVMRTSDGGRHWASTRVTPQFVPTRDFCTGSDPAVAYSSRDHAFYLSQLCFFRAATPSEVHVFKSLDNGATWTPGRQAAVAATNVDKQGNVDDSFFNDKEYIAVDNTPTSPYYGRLYVTYTRFHISDPNTGFSDSCPIQLSYTDNVPSQDPSQTVWNHVSVVPDDFGDNGVGPSANQFSVPVVQTNGHLDIAYVLEECNTSLDHGLRFQRSKDGGTSFLKEPVRVNKPGQWADNPNPDDLIPNTKFRAPNTVSLAYSPKTGTLAYVYTNYISGRGKGNIDVSLSHDGGKTWSDAQTISLQGGAPAPNNQFFPWIAATPRGDFVAIWLDRRQDPSNHDIGTFEARSTDDGSTWKNLNISTTTWNPDLGFFKSGAFIGDYSGIAANDSVTYPTWTDGRHSNIANTGIGETDVFTDVEINRTATAQQ
jgi:hypothetical protein